MYIVVRVKKNSDIWVHVVIMGLFYTLEDGTWVYCTISIINKIQFSYSLLKI